MTDAKGAPVKADNLRISKVFSSGGDIHYVLPHFQREYTWDKENWETLWEDALAIYDEILPASGGELLPEGSYAQVEHFLGSIVVIHDGMRSGTLSAFKLVDGQQRLTTISLFLKALAKAIETTHAPLSRKIDRLLVNGDEDGDLYFKILPTVKYGDRAAYCSILRGLPVPDNQSKVPIAYAFFQAKLSERLKEELNPERLLQVLINAFQVVFVILDMQESPYRIFESLNAKGKPLTQGDLVRNYVAMKLPAARQEAIFTQSWSAVENLLAESRKVGHLTELTAFLRHYLAMGTRVLCDEKHVYARFRDRAEAEFTTTEKFETEIQAIARFARFYDRLLRPEGFSDPEMAMSMKRLNQLESTSAYPFLLRLLDCFEGKSISKSDLTAALAVLENYMVRRYLAGEPQNYLNSVFPALWQDIDLQRLVESLKLALARRNYPSNAKILKALENRKMYGSGTTRSRTILVLDTINRKISEGTGGYTVLDSSATIEHVMPQTVSEDWKEQLGVMWEQIHRDYLHTLGNLTLVTAEWNSELSNGPFVDKRQLLAANALRLNAYFATPYPIWGHQEIRERAAALGDHILAIWPSFLPNDPTSESDSPRENSEFHFDALQRIAKKLHVPFKRVSSSRYESEDKSVRLVGVNSKAYARPGESIRFWYGVSPVQRQFLEDVPDAWIAFECELPQKILLFSLADFSPFFEKLQETNGKHWHVEFFETNGALELPLPLDGKRADVSSYLLRDD